MSDILMGVALTVVVELVILVLILVALMIQDEKHEIMSRETAERKL